jgi:hypothetical protein
MRRFLQTLFPSIIFLFQAQASLITNTECSLTIAEGSPQAHAAGPQSCSIVYPPNPSSRASSSINGVLDFSGNAIESHFQAEVIASPPFDEFIRFGAAEGIATGRSELYLTTEGPVRPGLIETFITITASAGPNLMTFDSALSVGPLSGQCHFVDPLRFARCVGDFPSDPGTTTLPFVLGETFLFQHDFYLRASSIRSDLIAIIQSGNVSLDFGFRLLEADGSPVQMSIVPEPATFLLIGFGLAGVHILRRRQTRFMRDR